MLGPAGGATARRERYFGRRQEYVDYLKSLEKPGIGRLLD
jgi:hypothetical protein